jgi:hypothetical protein
MESIALLLLPLVLKSILFAISVLLLLLLRIYVKYEVKMLCKYGQSIHKCHC